MRLSSRLLLLSLCLLLSLSLFSCASPLERVDNIAFTEIGNPSLTFYPQNSIARCPWDMIIYKNTLYLGNGDYDKNAGPVAVFSYDLSESIWETSAEIPDEEINRFLLLNGELAFTGVDPKEDWSFGNYYTLKEGVWVKNRVLPDAIHNFDLVPFEGMLFAAIGTLAGKSPVLCSTDGGDSFLEVPFVKDGAPFDTTPYELLRVYDLILFEGELYAVISYGDTGEGATVTRELYRYDKEEGAFLFDNEWGSKLTRIKYNHLRITADAEVDGTLYLTTGKLYATTDMETLTDITPEGVTLVCDLYKDKDDLYVLCASKAQDGSELFKTSLYKLCTDNEGNATLFEIFNFLYDIPPISVAVTGKHFYIGMGRTTRENDKNGTVLYVKY